MKVSVIIPTHNRLEELKHALKSVFNQTLLPTEIIIVDDASKDVVTIDIFDGAPKSINCVLHRNKEPKGANYSRNKAATLAKGDIIMFLDDDDTWESNKVKNQIEIFNSDPEAGLVYTGKKFVKSSNRNKIIRISRPKIEGYIFKKLFFSNVLGSTSGVAVKKEVFFKCGMFDENLKSLQDYDLWLRCSKIAKVRHDNNLNLRYTLHDNSSQISKNFEFKIHSLTYIKNKYKSDFDELNYLEKRKYLSSVDYSIAKALKLNNDKKYLIWLIKSLLKFPLIKRLNLLIS